MSIFNQIITRGMMIKASDLLDTELRRLIREEEDCKIIYEAYDRILECTDIRSTDRYEWLDKLQKLVNTSQIEEIPYMFD